MERQVSFSAEGVWASSGHASAGFNLPFSLGSALPRVLSARLLLPCVASLGRDDANAVTCTG